MQPSSTHSDSAYLIDMIDWTEKDLGVFPQTHFELSTALINESITILWKSFHFHS